MRLPFAIALLVPALPALAEEALFAAPAGCTVVATVQQASCSVSQLTTCAGDAPGTWHRITTYPGDYDFIYTTDAEGQWLATVDVTGGTADSLHSSADPVSLSELLATGRDTYDFTTLSRDGIEVRIVGTDTLAGSRIVIDDLPLERVTSDLRALDIGGGVIWHMTSDAFLMRDQRLFLNGPSIWQDDNGQSLQDDSPMEFAFAGEPGFRATTPRFGCDG